MHLTLFTDYALRALMFLTWNSGRSCTVDEIARHFNISADHVTKVMQHLARHGYVRSRRGRNGGAVLGREPEQIRLGEVLRDFEQVKLLDCLQTTGVCLIEQQCRLKKVIGEGQKLMMDYFDRHTVRDIAGPTILPSPAEPRRRTASKPRA